MAASALVYLSRRSWRKAAAAVAVAVLLSLAQQSAADEATIASSATDEAAARASFDQAMQRLGSGDAAQATTELIALAERFPHTSLAPEALFAAAQQLEESLSQPDRALGLYRRVVTEHPESRLLRRAESRLLQLAHSLKSGAAPLTRFQTIVRTTREASPERAQQLAALLTDHPQFALADEVAYLLLDGALRRSDGTEGELYRQLVTRHPHSEWSARGQQTYAEWLVRRGQLGAARAVYESLRSSPQPLWQATARSGLHEVATAERRRWLAAGSGLLLLLSLLGIGVRYRRQLWPPPAEVAYYVPVGLFFVLVAALVQDPVLARPLLWLLLGGGLLCWMSAAAARAQRSLGTARKVWGMLWRAGLALLLCYLAIERQGLWDLVLETLRNGPDR
jgi:TolA-binding protein